MKTRRRSKLRRKSNKKRSRIYRGGNKPPVFEIPHYIPRTVTGQTDISGTPLVIYKTWSSRRVPQAMKNAIYDTIKMSPEFDHYFYSDEECLQFIQDKFSKEPDIANAFKGLKPGAYKSDLWRYCILYINGGIYLDIKLVFLEPFIGILKESPTIFVKDRDIGCKEKKEFPLGIWNGFMASPPKNKIFKLCIDDIVKSWKTKSYKANSLDITGPCLLGEMQMRYGPPGFNNTLQFGNSNNIQYKNRTILKEYADYRKDLENFQVAPHYQNLYASRDVYY